MTFKVYDNTRMIQHFVFGYGSSIIAKCRSVATPEQGFKIATPALAKGIEFLWSKHTKQGMTAMGVEFVADGACVGVLLPVNDKELKQFDQLDQGYDRVRLDLADMESSLRRR
jgi:hypothetical protein